MAKAKGSPAERLARREIDFAEYLRERQGQVQKVLQRADRVSEQIERTLRQADQRTPSRR